MSAQPFEPSEPGTPAHPQSASSGRAALDRRAFLGAVGVAAGAALAASVAPIAAARAASLEASAAAPPARGPDMAGDGRPALAGDAADGGAAPWDIDDMWGHWPRYAHPIPHARVGPAAAAAAWQQIDPIDRMLVI